MNTNVNWEPTKGNHYQARRGIDENGNRYQMTANMEVVQCTTSDGFVSTGWTVQEALSGVLAQKAAAQKAADNAEKSADAPTIKGPANLSFADLCHWHQRGREVLGQPIIITAPAEA